MGENEDTATPVQVDAKMDVQVGDGVKKLARARMMQSIGVLMLGGSAMCTAIFAWILLGDNHDLRKEQECRFDISAEVSTKADAIDITTAEIFVAAIQDNDQEVTRLATVLDRQIDDLLEASQSRQEAVDTCRQG